jgi:hypothetical protein
VLPPRSLLRSERRWNTALERCGLLWTSTDSAARIDLGICRENAESALSTRSTRNEGGPRFESGRRLEKSCSEATCVVEKGDAEHFISRVRRVIHPPGSGSGGFAESALPPRRLGAEPARRTLRHRLGAKRRRCRRLHTREAGRMTMPPLPSWYSGRHQVVASCVDARISSGWGHGAKAEPVRLNHAGRPGQRCLVRRLDTRRPN